LNDSVWRNQEKSLNHSNDLFEQISGLNFTSKNISPVRRELKQDNSCFQYGFPSLFELNKIHTSRQSTYSFNHIEMTKEKKSQEYNKQCNNNSLFQYDLLFNQKISKEKIVTQSCPCCPPLNLSKTSSEFQQQKNSIIDKNIFYIRPISIKHIPEKSLSDNKIVQPTIKPLEDENNNPVLNKYTGEELNESNKVNSLMDDLNFVMISLKDKPLNNELRKRNNLSIPKETNNGNRNITDEKLNELNNFKTKSQTSTLTVEKVQSILEFYHSTSEDFMFEKNITYNSDDDMDSLDHMDFSDNNKVNLIKCSQCDKEFSNKNSRKKHVKNDHKLICKMCNKVSYNVKQMQHHEEKVHGTFIKKKPKRRSTKQTKRKRNPFTVRNYSCCGQNFNTGKEFGIHKSTHKFIGKKNLSYKM
jgi:hypothetical protein